MARSAPCRRSPEGGAVSAADSRRAAIDEALRSVYHCEQVRRNIARWLARQPLNVRRRVADALVGRGPGVEGTRVPQRPGVAR